MERIPCELHLNARTPASRIPGVFHWTAFRLDLGEAGAAFRFHALRDLIGKEHDLAINMSRGAAGSLDQRSLAAQKAFLVGVENADERNFGKIESFSEQIDADENIEIGRAQAAQDFHTLNCVDVAVEIAHL